MQSKAFAYRLWRNWREHRSDQNASGVYSCVAFAAFVTLDGNQALGWWGQSSFYSASGT